MSTEPERPRKPFQFGLGTLLLLMLLCSVLSAALAGMLRDAEGRSSLPPGFFIFMAAAAPLGLMILMSLYRAIIRFRSRR